jgi:hypothetical protein
MNLHRLLAALAALALVAAGCGTADERGERGDRGQTLSPGNAAVDRARERYSALRAQNGESPSTLPSEDRKHARTTVMGKPFAVHPVVRRPGYEFHVLETTDELCTYEIDGGGAGAGCGPPDGFVQGGLSYSVGGPPYRITAFLPDGSSDVTLTHADGSTSQLDLRNNHATKVFDELPERATYTLPDGTEKSTALHGPPEESVPGEAERTP